jgi:Domain of unknown function (DUF4118)
LLRVYGAAVLAVLVALLISHWPFLHLESAPVLLFLCAVMFSAWLGGVGSGLLATVLSAIAFYYSFLPPLESFVAKPSQTPRFLVFIVSSLFVGSLSVVQRKTTESLRRTRDDLDETVQELKKTNEALGKSEAYLAEAQTVSHTGSFGWDFSTGDLFWSEESFRIFGFDRAHCATGARTESLSSPRSTSPRRHCSLPEPLAYCDSCRAIGFGERFLSGRNGGDYKIPGSEEHFTFHLE